MSQDWCSGEGIFQQCEGRAALIREIPSSSFVSEAGEWNSDFGVFWNEMPIKIGEAQEGLDVFNLSGFGPILNDLDFVRGHGKAIRR